MNLLTTRLFILFTFLCLFQNATICAQDCIGEDCMWPGDANRNGICNNMDILWVGLAFQDMTGGFIRENATTTWTPQTPPVDWVGFHPVSNINYKYADTDADGWISGGDLNFFPDLYGQSNEHFTSFLGNEIPGNDLFLVPSNPTPALGESLELSIQLGTEENPINDIYGIAFTIEIDTSIVKEELTTFSNLGGWMNISDTSLYTLAKINTPIEVVHPEFAFVLLFEEGVSGFGEIGKVNIVIEDIIFGLEGIPIENAILNFKIHKVLGLNTQEEDMLIAVNQSSLIVTSTATVQKPISYIHIQHYAEAQRLNIQSSSRIIQATLIDMTGKTIYQRKPKGTELEIFTPALPAGIYLVHIKTTAGEITRKFFLGLVK